MKALTISHLKNNNVLISYLNGNLVISNILHFTFYLTASLLDFSCFSSGLNAIEMFVVTFKEFPFFKTILTYLLKYLNLNVYNHIKVSTL